MSRRAKIQSDHLISRIWRNPFDWIAMGGEHLHAKAQKAQSRCPCGTAFARTTLLDVFQSPGIECVTLFCALDENHAGHLFRIKPGKRPNDVGAIRVPYQYKWSGQISGREQEMKVVCPILEGHRVG